MQKHFDCAIATYRDAFPAGDQGVAVGQVLSDLQANYALISQSGFMSVCPKGSNFQFRSEIISQSQNTDQVIFLR